jgi:hypothetical protein
MSVSISEILTGKSHITNKWRAFRWIFGVTVLLYIPMFFVQRGYEWSRLPQHLRNLGRDRASVRDLCNRAASRAPEVRATQGRATPPVAS